MTVEETRAYQKSYKIKYALLYPDKVLESRRKWYLKHKEKQNIATKQWAKNNPDKVKQYSKNWASENRLLKKVREANSRYVGELTLSILQLVYEDNIKKYGTLTCYLCLKPILFTDDSLDHRTPAVRGGTNEYDNLGVAHRSCNVKKRYKTESEYREVLNVL